MTKFGTFSQEQIKEINRVNVINAIRNNKETTKHEVSRILKLSIPTVTSNINALIKEGFVYESGVAQSTGGRKPVLLSFNENARFSFGVNITLDQMTIILMNLNGEIIESQVFDYLPNNNFDQVVTQIKETILNILKKRQISKKKVVGIGLSLPGLVDEDKLILDSAPNLGVKEYDFHSFQEALEIQVYVENEANIAAYGETLQGNHKNMSNVVYISITEGVGTGIIINNQIYKSANKKAGEFGHMRISDENLQCNCGRTGCWELFASKRALIRYFFEETGQSEEDLSVLLSDDNLQKPAVKVALQKYFDYLFIGIENIVLGLNPEYVIIGGELGKYRQQLLQFINEEKQLKSSYMVYEGTRIIFSDLADQASVIGAALLPQQSIFYHHNNVI